MWNGISPTRDGLLILSSLSCSSCYLANHISYRLLTWSEALATEGRIDRCSLSLSLSLCSQLWLFTFSFSLSLLSLSYSFSHLFFSHFFIGSRYSFMFYPPFFFLHSYYTTSVFSYHVRLSAYILTPMWRVRVRHGSSGKVVCLQLIQVRTHKLAPESYIILDSLHLSTGNSILLNNNHF